MLKRVLHTAQQVVTHEETHTESVIENTVNAPAGVVVKGDSRQGSTTGAQLFDVESCTEVSSNRFYGELLENGYVSVSYDNSESASTKEVLLFSPLLAIEPSTKYRAVLELPEWENIFSFCITNGHNAAQTQFNEFIQINEWNYKEVSSKIFVYDVSTQEDVSMQEYGFRTLVVGKPNSVIKVKYRLSLISMNVSNYNWEPYTGGKPSPSLAYPQEIISTFGVLKAINNGYNGDKLRESQITIPELRAIPGTDIRDELVVYPDGSGKIVRNACKAKLVSGGLRLVEQQEGFIIYILDGILIRIFGFAEYTKYNGVNGIGNVNCTHFKNCWIGGNYHLYMKFCIDECGELPTLEEVKSLIDNEDVYILYALQNPIEEPLTSEQVGILRTAQYHTEIIWEGLDEHLKPEVEVTAKHIGR